MFPFKFLSTLQEQTRIRLQYGPEFIGDSEKIEVGLTERVNVLKEGSHNLYFYQGINKTEKKIPILLIYSLINRSYIFDLRPGRSLIEYLINQGFDVYLLDWGDPTPDMAYKSLEEMIGGTLHRFIRWIRRENDIPKINLLGYCMGGTFATIYSGIHPELINKLVLLTTPLGNDEGGTLQNIAKRINWGKAVSEAGIVSGRQLKLFFSSVKPVGSIKKERDFWLNYDQEKFIDNFLPVEKWSNDTPDLPGQAFFEFLDICFVKDQLKSHKLSLGNSRIDFTKITFPVFSVAAQHDWIIPPSALDTVKEVLPNAEHKIHLLPGGHIGLVVGKQAVNLWEQLKEFFSD